MEIFDIFVRLGMALLAGMVIGGERESHGRAAGFRTTTLTCVSSCLAMILSAMMFSESSSSSISWRPDPARLAAGILAGMGFLGGAAIIKQENVVRGVTTAAVLWFVSILGLVFGSGHIVLGILSTGMALFILYILPYLELYIKTDWYSNLSITLLFENLEVSLYEEQSMRKNIEDKGVSIKETSAEYDMDSKTKFIKYSVKFKKQNQSKVSDDIMNYLTRLSNVRRVKWE